MPTLIQQLRAELRLRHFSPRTEKAYVAWVKRYVRFSSLRHPRECGAHEVGAFLQDLASNRKVAASTQNQALAALQFLYRQVVKRPLVGTRFARAKTPVRVPNVLAPEEIEGVLRELANSDVRLVVGLLYGAGLRLGEAVSLRVKDIDLRRKVITVRGGKGGKDRRTVLPEVLIPAIAEQVERVRRLNLLAVRSGRAAVPLPHALAAKYPRASADWRWTWVFPASRRFRERRTGRWLLWHVHETTVHRAIRRAAERSGINRRVSAHTFRHSFATHLLRNGYDIRTVQELLGHRDVSTTMVYLHVLDTGAGVRSPLDRLATGS
jgi:integron integrase